MKKTLLVIGIMFLQVFYLDAGTENVVTSLLTAEKTKVIRETKVGKDHQMVRAFKETDGYRNFNSGMFGKLRFDRTIFYEFESDYYRAISVPIISDDENIGRYLVSWVDLEKQEQMTRVIEVFVEPSDGSGNKHEQEPQRLTGSVQVLDHGGALKFGAKFDNGVVVHNYGNYILPCQGAVISMFTGSVIGGLLGGPVGLLGAYLNGLVGVMMACCCD